VLDFMKPAGAARRALGVAEEMTLSRHTVNTIIGKLDGTDRTTAKRRQMLGLEPRPKKDWRHAAMRRLPKQAQEYFEQSRELVKEGRK
jgi:hypothetical protein